jgi:hypothetical protein
MNGKPQPALSPQNRTARVFVSSTFHDMQEEQNLSI